MPWMPKVRLTKQTVYRVQFGDDYDRQYRIVSKWEQFQKIRTCDGGQVDTLIIMRKNLEDLAIFSDLFGEATIEDEAFLVVAASPNINKIITDARKRYEEKQRATSN